MTERRMISKKKQHKASPAREKTEGEKRFAAAVLKMREKGIVNPQEQLDGSNVEDGEETSQVKPKAEPTGTAQSASKQEIQVIPFAPALEKKKEKFEEKHNRVTTYISKKNHEKLKRIRKEYDVPLSETLNKALEEYFKKYNM